MSIRRFVAALHLALVLASTSIALGDEAPPPPEKAAPSQPTDGQPVAGQPGGEKTVAEKPAPAKPDSEGFEPVKPGELASGEQLPANMLVAGAYGFILACLVVWVASVAVRARKVQEELEALRAQLDKRS